MLSIWVFAMTWHGIKSRSPGQLVNTLTITPMSSKKKKEDINYTNENLGDNAKNYK